MKKGLPLALTLFTLTLLSCAQNEEKTSSTNEESISSEMQESSQIEYGSTYFFDSSKENGDGSEQSPFSSFEDIKKINLEAGDRLLFKKGSSFSGGITLEDLHGEKNKPIVISSYGEGALPKIDGNNHLGTGIVYIKNCSYLTFRDFEIFDSSKEEGDRRGVLVELSSNTAEIKTYDSIHLENLYVHDIYGTSDAQNMGMSMASKVTGGIHLWSKDGKARSNDFLVRNCHIEDVSNVGIATWYKVVGAKIEKVSPYDETFSQYAHTNLTLENNEINNIAKNAIFLRNALDSKITNNLVHDTATTCKAGNSIVTSYVDNILVERNEGYNNLASVRENGNIQDGAMLDPDLQSKKVLFQYNYSHDNSFGLFLNCNSASKTSSDEVILRYNVSVNDLGKKGIIYMNYHIGKMECYNNTIISTSVSSPILLEVNNDRKLNFYNNLIYCTSENPSLKLGNQTNLFTTCNVVYSEKKIENIEDLENFESFNPKPKTICGDSLAERIGMDKAKEFVLMRESKLFDSSNCISIESKPVDFLGNEYKESIGAINRI